MQLDIDRHSRRPLYLQVVEQIKQHIRAGALPAGTRLPTVRQLAAEIGVTRLTIHNAYSELQADGWIESFVGRGSFVSERAASKKRGVEAAPPVPVARRPGAMAELMQLVRQPDVISFAQAAPAPETFPAREFGRCVQQVVADAGESLYGYGATQGEVVLRDQLAAFLLDRSVQVSPAQIVVVGGAQQGIDIVVRALLRPGDAMLVEAPTYLGLIERVDGQGPRLHGVPMDEEGIRLDALEQAIAAHSPRLLYTVPTYHNPSGTCMSAARRQGLLRLAARHNLSILEDDIYGLLSYDGRAPSPLMAEDTAGVVIYLTSFSKMLMPGLRMGLLAAPPALLDSLIAAKRLCDLHAPQLTQCALAAYLASGAMAGHLRMVKALYRQRRDAMVARLRQAFPPEARWCVPSGGLCLWVELPPGIRAMELYLEALDRGVAFAPGEAFFAEPQANGYLRLAWGAQPPELIARGISILGELLHEHVARYRRLRGPIAREIIPMV